MTSEDQVENDEVDAASAMSYNEYLLLLENGYSEDDLNVIDPNKVKVQQKITRSQ